MRLPFCPHFAAGFVTFVFGFFLGPTAPVCAQDDDPDHHHHATPTLNDAAWMQAAHRVRHAETDPLANLDLPPLPADVTDLSFREFFRMPVGPRGLEPTTKLEQLNGHRVRIAGFMVRQETAHPGTFLLTPLPVQTNESEYGQADELPVNTLRVLIPDQPDAPVPLTAGILLLTGRLELGSREEPDGRTSFARLFLDPTPPTGPPTAHASPVNQAQPQLP